MLGTVSRHGRAALIVGLLTTFLLPSLANVLKPRLPQLVMVLLFLVALRIGPSKARGGMSDSRATLAVVLILQLGLPLGVIAVAHIFGVTHPAHHITSHHITARQCKAAIPTHRT